MNNFLRGGRGMAVGQSDKVTQLSRYHFPMLGTSRTSLRDGGISRLPMIEKKRSLCRRIDLSVPLSSNRGDGEIWLKAYSLWPKAFIIIFCVLFSGLSVSPAPARAQEAGGLNKIPPLKVGDQIPEELWDMPLKVVNHPEGKEYIRLSDHPDKKLIVLDFWSSWCSSCINKMPESARLKQEFSDKIHIIYSSSEPENKVKRIIENVPGREQLDYVYEDSIFNKVFPHRLVPHVVWINNDREIIAITSGQDLSSTNIQSYIQEGRLNIQLKQDVLDFDHSLALKKNLDKLSIIPLQNYTSCLSSAIPGIGSNSGVEKDMISHINSNILALYRTALNLSAIHKNISIDTASALFQFTKAGNELYCYELSAKTDLSICGLKEIMLTDLNRFFNCDVELKTNRGSAYYVLRDKSRKEGRDGYK